MGANHVWAGPYCGGGAGWLAGRTPATWYSRGLTAPSRLLQQPKVALPVHAPWKSPRMHTLACGIGVAVGWGLCGPWHWGRQGAVASVLQPPVHLEPKTPSTGVLGTETWESWGGRPLKTLSETRSFRLHD